MKTVAFHNLGCKVNSYELDIMQQILTEKGYQVVAFDQKADIYVVNTCTVTNIADRKSRQMLHRAKQKNPDAVVVAVGCYVQTDSAGVDKDPCIDLAIGNNRKKDIGSILEQFLSEREASEPEQDKTLGGTTILDIAHTNEYEEATLTKTAEHTRAYIKIQDGCNQFCSYCAIPLARGRVRSRRQEDVLREIEGMVRAGYKEVVLTGIHISSYGIDLQDEGKQDAAGQNREQGDPASEKTASCGTDYRGRSQLLELVERVHEIPGLRRIRISSLEPRIVTQEAARRLAALPKVCPHFHLSLQSGCDETLKRMNRHYTTAQFAESVRALREAYAPKPVAVTTDVIVGFPGETEEEFETSKAFLEETCFYEMHVFKYSKRANTRAAVMPGQIPEQVKAARSDVLLELTAKQSVEFRKHYLGKCTEVLLEEEKELDGERYLLGHTMDYVRVALPAEGSERKPNEEVRIRIDGFLTEELLQGHEADLF